MLERSIIAASFTAFNIHSYSHSAPYHPLQCINMFFGGCFLSMASTWSKRQLSIENFSEVTDHIQRIISRTPSKIFSFWLSLEPQTTQMLGPVSPASPDSECAPPPASRIRTHIRTLAKILPAHLIASFTHHTPLLSDSHCAGFNCGCPRAALRCSTETEHILTLLHR
jgi:hypothetical protein